MTGLKIVVNSEDSNTDSSSEDNDNMRGTAVSEEDDNQSVKQVEIHKPYTRVRRRKCTTKGVII